MFKNKTPSTSVVKMETEQAKEVEGCRESLFTALVGIVSGKNCKRTWNLICIIGLKLHNFEKLNDDPLLVEKI